MGMQTRDVFSLAYRTVRSNKLRTGLTVAIIAFGIMALIGIITAIAAMNQKLSESFSTMGANGFTIRYKARQIRFGGGGGGDLTIEKKGQRKARNSSLDKRITLEEADAFKKYFSFPATVGASMTANRNTIVSFGTKKTTPNVMLIGADESYLLLNGIKIAAGRNMNRGDAESARNLCLLGVDVASRLFGENKEKAVNAVIRVNDIPYRVLGVMGSRGSSFGFSRDNLVLTSYRNIDRNFSSNNASYTIAVITDDLKQVPNAMGEAEGTFRAIRKLATTEESNFVLDRNDAIVEKAMKSLSFLTVSVTVIGLITLIGAAIGLMNIMLVSVTERTKEVGLIKAIGGKSKLVRRQFLLEAIIISMLGAFFGIVLGVILGNGAALIFNTSFVVPWRWVIYGVVICTLVGLLAGLYPALKAGRLNPIEALRYE
jgi:putative ABC transport system permease protein